MHPGSTQLLLLLEAKAKGSVATDSVLHLTHSIDDNPNLQSEDHLRTIWGIISKVWFNKKKKKSLFSKKVLSGRTDIPR